jgi:hypothetical protein
MSTAIFNILRRHLHPALKKLNYVNSITGTYKAGNHAFRRFRNTFLRNHTGCPKGLRKFWLGHAGEDMSELYDKIKEDLPFRKEWAGKAGFGFELPSVVPTVPRIEVKDEAMKVDKVFQNVRGRMVRAERFELPTFWFVARRSIQLSYARMRT